MAENEKIILVTNDDGIHAPGLKALVRAVDSLGKVVIVAPDNPQSGVGHAVTLRHPLRMRESSVFPNHEAYETTGTPVDCVKLAVDQIFHKKPDLLVSGINHGSNSSINIIYSGTMSAALEGAIESIAAVGFSLCDYSQNADFGLAEKVVHRVAKQVLERGLPNQVALNVNIPKVGSEDYKGLKICRQANAKWSENFDERKDPTGKDYYWLTGVFQVSDHGEDTDEWALKNNFASVVPVQLDLTAHHALGELNKWNLNE